MRGKTVIDRGKVNNPLIYSKALLCGPCDFHELSVIDNCKGEVPSRRVRDVNET